MTDRHSHGTVLELAGSLAHEVTQARLTLESLAPESEAVVVCRRRRIQLLLSQNTAYDLCRAPHCQRHPIGSAITTCTEHLGDCDARALAGMARDWGYIRRDDAERDPARLGGRSEGDLLIKAAVVLGTFERVRGVLLDAAFGDPNLFDDEFSDPAEALAMQHALERERLRLHEVGRAEGLRIRKTISSCTGCGHQLYGWNPVIPPQYCHKCAPPQPAEHPLYAFAD
ncbi:hypothetical protein [Streptomyces geranii]|uniref:hypothetical protein n=1 Tax=Streptomyces geranii TaxID=2058923 RepID=UPI000D02479C|nr:hypothetical protein [Streptomyces geranii]